MPQCLFCRIVAGRAPAEIVHQDDLVTAILDIQPIRPGHTQIVSRQHVPYFEDLPETTASRIIHVGQRLSRAMKSLYGVERVAFAAITRMCMRMCCPCMKRPISPPGDTSRNRR